MHARALIALLMTVLTLFFAGCLEEEKVVTPDMRGSLPAKKQKSDDTRTDNENRTNDTQADNATATNGGRRNFTAAPGSIEEQLNSMTLAEKVGQMVMIGVYGTKLNDDIRYLLSEFHFGGVIFFDRNLNSVAQAKNFVRQIETAANQKVPLFFATDEEGGSVSRGDSFLEVAPSQESIGQSGDVTAAAYWARHNAQILRSIGVNLNFAPVADVGSRDTRSFGDDAQIVAEFVDAAARGYEAENFLYTLKHFPGIGKSKIDTHIEVSSVEDSLAVLDAEDLPPFVTVIRGHDNSKFMIMVGHLKYDALDPYNSASLSPAVMTDLLRNELGFSGVIITDDLEMGAIKNNVDLATLGVRMILAGGDIALVCHDYDSQQIVYNSILNAVERGEISEERINESVRRILKMKQHLRRS